LLACVGYCFLLLYVFLLPTAAERKRKGKEDFGAETRNNRNQHETDQTGAQGNEETTSIPWSVENKCRIKFLNYVYNRRSKLKQDNICWWL
jgi:hypothetical protein